MGALAGGDVHSQVTRARGGTTILPQVGTLAGAVLEDMGRNLIHLEAHTAASMVVHAAHCTKEEHLEVKNGGDGHLVFWRGHSSCHMFFFFSSLNYAILFKDAFWQETAFWLVGLVC